MGIISYIAWHYVNLFIFNSHSITITYQITHFDIESLITQLLIMALVTLIALFLPTYRYGIAICKLLVFLIGIYGAIVLGAFIASGIKAYLSLICLGIQLFSLIWLLGIGIPPIKYSDKIKLALIPFLFLIIASFCPIVA